MDAQFVDARGGVGGARARHHQARSAGHQRHGAVGGFQVGGRRRFIQSVAGAGMGDIAFRRNAHGVGQARLAQVEGMVVGQRQQVEAEAGQRFQRRRGRQEAAAAAAGHGLAFLRDHAFEIGELHIAGQQPLDHRHFLRRGYPEIGAHHRLPRQGEGDGLVLRHRGRSRQRAQRQRCHCQKRRAVCHVPISPYDPARRFEPAARRTVGVSMSFPAPGRIRKMPS